mgnify:CR=1 FL=1|jgi:hypothetical protein
MKKTILFYLLLLCKVSLANPASGISSFEVKEMHTDKIFYNVVLFENDIYVGTNDGVYIINPLKGSLTIHNKSVIGTIKSDLSKSSSGLKIKFIVPPTILPENYKNTVTDFAYNKNYLYVISKGDLLIFENKPYTFSAHGSVRSITKNTLGTYSGVFIGDTRLKKTNYTDGQIKEFDSIAFVCYNGLVVVKDSEETILYDNSNSKYSNAEYGRISDIFFIGDSHYLLISSYGIYRYHFTTNNFDLVYSANKRIISIKNKIDNRILNNSEFHFVDGNNYLSLNTTSFKTSVIQDNFNFGIQDMLECSFDGSIFYAIGKNNTLYKFKRSAKGVDVVKTYQMNSAFHTIADVEDLIFLTGNEGLTVFEKAIEKTHPNFIIDEFNSSAVYKSDKDISFGSIHGVYKIKNVSNLKNSTYLRNTVINVTKKLNIDIIITLIVLGTCFLILRIIRKKSLSNDQVVEHIKRFITKNLNTVTLFTIQEKFDLDYNAINSLQKGFSPAKFIKQERNNKAKVLFLNDEPISKISTHTGYSESYLLKNKYNFLKA